MSFSGDVKKELAGLIPSGRHCRIAALAAILGCIGEFEREPGGEISLTIRTDNHEVLKKYFTLLSKTLNIYGERLAEKSGVRTGRFVQKITEPQAALLELAEMLKLLQEDGTLRSRERGVSPLLLKNSCCQRTFLRDTFLCTGSVSDPEREYHLEYVCAGREQAAQIRQVLQEQGIEAREIQRKKYHVVYVKDSAEIVTILNIMGAHVALMNMENSRILKEMRNSVNRRVNCEMANIEKTVTASHKQIEDILYIQSSRKYQNLPESLRQMAEVRLRYPEAALKELGNLLEPPIGKSGVNHRLRKLSEFADSLREEAREQSKDL